MKKAVWSGIIAAVGALALSTPAFAQTTATVTVNATVAAKARLTVSATAISFADEDPDTVSVIPANTGLNISVKARTGPRGANTAGMGRCGLITVHPWSWSFRSARVGCYLLSRSSSSRSFFSTNR